MLFHNQGRLQSCLPQAEPLILSQMTNSKKQRKEDAAMVPYSQTCDACIAPKTPMTRNHLVTTTIKSEHIIRLRRIRIIRKKETTGRARPLDHHRVFLHDRSKRHRRWAGPSRTLAYFPRHAAQICLDKDAVAVAVAQQFVLEGKDFVLERRRVGRQELALLGDHPAGLLQLANRPLILRSTLRRGRAVALALRSAFRRIFFNIRIRRHHVFRRVREHRFGG